MTVQELIDELEKIIDRGMKVRIPKILSEEGDWCMESPTEFEMWPDLNGNAWLLDIT